MAKRHKRNATKTRTPSKRSRSLAAKKGWITRRANARSLAAKKGWITRRANARSLAAKKGWITRRANAQRQAAKRAKTGTRTSSPKHLVTKKTVRVRTKKPTARPKTAQTTIRPKTQRRSKATRKPKNVEYSVNVDYRVKGKGNAISVQFSVMAPPNLTAHDVQRIIIDTIASEGESPDGTKVRIIDWKGGRVPEEIPWDTLAVVAGEPFTRFRIS